VLGVFGWWGYLATSTAVVFVELCDDGSEQPLINKLKQTLRAQSML